MRLCLVGKVEWPWSVARDFYLWRGQQCQATGWTQAGSLAHQRVKIEANGQPEDHMMSQFER